MSVLWKDYHINHESHGQNYCYVCNQPTQQVWVCDDHGIGALLVVLKAIYDAGEPVRTNPTDSYYGYKPDPVTDPELSLDEGI